jgi:hypothetical protein
VGRPTKVDRPVKRVIKLTLDPRADAELIAAIDVAPNKARLIVDALRGRPVSVVTATPAERDALAEDLAAFVM